MVAGFLDASSENSYGSSSNEFWGEFLWLWESDKGSSPSGDRASYLGFLITGKFNL